jgi:hypothetical protein
MNTSTDQLDALDREILITLTQHVPLLEVSQARLVWWRNHESAKPAATRLARLRQLGWLDHYRLDLKWPLLRYQPEFAWNPGDEAPIIRNLRNWARKAEASGMVIASDVYVASAFTANAYGVSHRGRIQADQFTELLAWGQVYVRKCKVHSDAGKRWNAEGIFNFDTKSGRLPQHISYGFNATSEPLICLLAHSSQKSLVALHEQCLEQSRPYEMW